MRYTWASGRKDASMALADYGRKTTGTLDSFPTIYLMDSGLKKTEMWEKLDKQNTN